MDKTQEREVAQKCFEDLDRTTQEVIIGLFVSILENKMRRGKREAEEKIRATSNEAMRENAE